MLFDHNKFNQTTVTKISANISNIWKLNKILIHNPWVREEIKREIKEHFELKKKGKTVHQIWGDIVKTVLRGKLITLNAYIRKKKLMTLHTHRGTRKRTN